MERWRAKLGQGRLVHWVEPRPHGDKGMISVCRINAGLPRFTEEVVNCAECVRRVGWA